MLTLGNSILENADAVLDAGAYYCLDGAGGTCHEFHSGDYPQGNWRTSYNSKFTNTPSGFKAYCQSWTNNKGTYNGGSGTCDYYCLDGAGGECHEFHSADYPQGNWRTSYNSNFTNDQSGFKAYCQSWRNNKGTYNGGSGTCDYYCL